MKIFTFYQLCCHLLSKLFRVDDINFIFFIFSSLSLSLFLSFFFFLPVRRTDRTIFIHSHKFISKPRSCGQFQSSSSSIITRVCLRPCSSIDRRASRRLESSTKCTYTARVCSFSIAKVYSSPGIVSLTTYWFTNV